MNKEPIQTDGSSTEPPERKTIETPAKSREPARTAKPSSPRRRRIWRPPPVLRFSPTAWAKLLFFRDSGDTEIGGFGITKPNDLLFVEDFITVKQQVTCVSVLFDDAAVADFFEVQVDAGRKPEQFARCWCHTHPGDSPTPSGTDEETFDRVFGGCEWAVMFILAKGGQTYARLRFNSGPGGDVLIPVEVEFGRQFEGSDFVSWEEEYDLNVWPLWQETKAPSSTTVADKGLGWPDEPASPSSMHPTEEAWYRDAFLEYEMEAYR